MPGTTRYSATFDRPYEEEDPPAAPPVTRRSRSQSLQAESITGFRGGYGPLFGNSSSSQHARSSSIENGDKAQASKGAEVIPTRTSGKTTVKTHNNPFQFVKVGTCPLYKSAEELLKKTKEVKKAPVIKEEEEEWQSNLDSWKSRRRKMSEGAFRRQEELRKLELEEQNVNSQQQQQKKIKTFSEMVEERAHRGRALSLCLFSSPLDSSEWIFENTKREKKSRSQDLLSEESAESSNINSDEDNDNYSKQNSNLNNGNIDPHADRELNGVRNSTSNSSISKNSDLSELDVSQDSISQKDQTSFGGFIDSGLESLSSSHRTGDIPDSGSDFSQDSGSSIDCDSPRVSGLITTGIELLEEFSSKEECTNGSTVCLKEKSDAPVTSEKPKPVPAPTSVLSKNAPVGKNTNDSPKVANKELKPKSAKSQTKSPKGSKPTPAKAKTNTPSHPPEKSVESENEMFVDDFEELARLKTSEQKSPTPVIPQKPVSQLNGLDSLHDKSSLNVIYQSDSSSSKGSIHNGSLKNDTSYSLISEIPVEKVTEEMEKLILQQLEDEERAKEVKFNGDKSELDIPAKKVEPPKEKPPPPPVNNSSPTKDCSVNRVNSTKRILKEINKRRSDFLGIDPAKQDSNINEEPSVPPPPALEDILKAEREQNRLRRQMLEATAASRALPEEDEITRKEREIIENLETEERLKSAQGMSTSVPDFVNAQAEEQRFKELQEERKRIEEEIIQAEEQRIRLEEAALLQKREQQVKEQEEVKPAESNASLSSLDAPALNTGKPETSLAVSNANLAKNGDGINNESSLSSPNSEVEVVKPKEQPPPVAPKPCKKKKEALRRERERLRQEQEMLQREREEHRKQIQQEQLKISSPPHVHDAPVSQVGPPPPAKPVLPSHVLIHSSPASSSSSLKREVPGSGLSNCNKPAVVGISSGVQSHSKPSSRNRTSPSRSKAVVNELRNQPKVLSRKPETSAERRYNQNHWLIQEAEMRRIMEQNERQRIQSNSVQYTQYPEEMHRPAQNPNAKAAGYPLQGPPECYGQQFNPSAQTKLCAPVSSQCIDSSHYLATYSKQFEPSVPAPMKPSRVAPVERQEQQMLSVSGRKRCSHCGVELGRGAAMIIESLQLYYHIHCFRCCVCEAQLGNGSCGTDVRVRNNKLHCHNCYSNDEAGLKFSQV